jgi:hypothetical protein
MKNIVEVHCIVFLTCFPHPLQNTYKVFPCLLIKWKKVHVDGQYLNKMAHKVVSRKVEETTQLTTIGD